MSLFSRWLPPIVFLAFVLCVLEGLARWNFVPNYMLAAPSAVALSLFENFEAYRHAVQETLTATVTGLMLSVLAGLSFAVIFSALPLLKRAILPFSVFFQTVPIVAIAPLLVIWFGFGMPTVIASSAIVSFFPILASALQGFDSSRQSHRELFQVLGARTPQTIQLLYLPSAIPSILSGFRIASGLAVIGSVVGEFVGGGGLGGLIDAARTQQKTEMVFGAVLLSSVLGLFLVAVVNLLGLSLKRFRNPT